MISIFLYKKDDIMDVKEPNHEKSSPSHKLHHPCHKQLLWSTYCSPLLHPWWQPNLVLELARDLGLPHHLAPHRLCLHASFQDGPSHIGKQVFLHGTIYAYGLSRLPVSTASLIIALQLAFTAVFAFLLVKQKFTAYSINAVFAL
ncbi:hypothetical protein J1N35_006658 [Gossypium stocksii]|uniref:Uncharacterized protein n=1 Tax=Gossypium stocksii TaxID=47602 RepID=A0A9D4AEU9_9ROSI|nr:hypothetical protein J1N35_006658 [Gossypium stocksii]